MKLRNKKTGEITEAISIHDGFICVDWKGDSGIYSTLASLNKEFEDYKPTEPLIKDEKVRKAVRAWAEANDINSNHYYETDVIKFSSSEHEFTWIDTSIQFDEITGLESLEDGKRYTIAELCGEDEE